MANEIKLKRGSGSDPTASDLAVGEVALRTDTALLFTKNDGGSVVPIGISDGDKGDITVSSNGGTFTIDNDAVTYAKIQNVSATDRLLGRDSSGAGIIEELAPSAVRTMLGLATSATTDTTNASNISSGTLAAARVATLNQDTTGNAATATALETARNIAGVSFDGTANISLNNNAITNGAGYITDLVNDTSPQLGGDLDTNSHNISLDDDHKVNFGDSNDLQIYHESGFNQIYTANSSPIQLRTASELMIKAIPDAEVQLYFNGSKKAETVTGGFTVTGTCTATAFAGDGSSLTGISAGATGGGSDEIFYENGQNVTTDYTITNGKNAMSAGPITIDSGVTVTVGAGETLTIV